MSANYLEHDIPEDTCELRKQAEELLTARGYGDHFAYFRSVQHLAAGDINGLRVRGYAPLTNRSV